VKDAGGGSYALRLERAYAVSREEVFRAFTDPALARQWLKPRGFVIEEFDFTPAVGRAYRVSLRGPDGVRYAHAGVFLRVAPPEELAYTWRWVEGPLPPDETLVELSFLATAEGTLLRLCHSRFPSDAVRDQHLGWRAAFEALDAWLGEHVSRRAP
jgi:uncharacterized protein YndB with AHSA1/START domain